jgi:hypothetical protein
MFSNKTDACMFHMFSDGDCGYEINKDGFVPCIELREGVKFYMKEAIAQPL